MRINSVSFEQNHKIPVKYTCDGTNVNPPLSFSDIPKDAKSLVLIVDDPDAPSKIWVHWVLYNIDPKTNSIEENSVPNGAVEGRNDFGETEYGGPCPPSGVHRYFFKLYALNNKLSFQNGLTKDELLDEISGHIIDSSELIGLFGR